MTFIRIAKIQNQDRTWITFYPDGNFAQPIFQIPEYDFNQMMYEIGYVKKPATKKSPKSI
jgi:hypothetical protein